ncbi:MAG: hypothetical protein ABIY55_03300 [Kofleriaceae bacterium]
MASRLQRGALWLVMAGALATARAAGAQPGPTAIETAEQLFDRARQLLKDQRYAEACAAFGKSFEVGRLIGAELNLGDCAERDGHLAAAWRLFDAAARDWARQGDDDRATVARKKADQVAMELATIVVTLAEPVVAGTRLQIGGRDVAPAREVRELVEPADVDVLVTLPGHLPIRRTAHARLGAVATIDVPAPGHSMTAVVTPPHDGVLVDRERSLLAPISVGLAAVALGGTAIGVWRLSASANRQSQLDLSPGQQQRDHELANREYYLAQGLGVASVACAGVALWLYLRSAGDDRPATANRVAIAPMRVGDGAWLMFEGSY